MNVFFKEVEELGSYWVMLRGYLGTLLRSESLLCFRYHKLGIKIGCPHVRQALYLLHSLLLLRKFPLNVSENLSSMSWEVRKPEYYISETSWACIPELASEQNWELHFIEYLIRGKTETKNWQESTETEIPKHIILQIRVWHTSRGWTHLGGYSQITKVTKWDSNHLNAIPYTLHGNVFQTQLHLGRSFSLMLACLKLACLQCGWRSFLHHFDLWTHFTV